MQAQLSTPQDRNLSLGISIGVHVVVLILLLFFFKFTYPDPPIGSETISVSLARKGNSQAASGATQQGQEVSTPTPQPTQNPTPTPTTPAATTPVTTQSSSTTQVQEQTDTEPTESQEPEQQVDDKLNDLFGTLSGGGSDESDGETQGSGIEGTENGDIEGRGVVGNDKPYGFNLNGRGLMGEPSVDRNFSEEGLVVFDIYVDKDGKLTDLKRNYGLSTTSSDQLFRIGEKALNTVTFSPNPAAPHIQKGQFTFRFSLK